MLSLAQNMNGKTIGIAIKDRSAILPAGHTANAAYWFQGGGEGKWSSLKPGHGVGFKTDGHSNFLSERFGPELSFASTLNK